MAKPLIYWRLNLLDPPRLPTLRRMAVHDGWRIGGDAVIVGPREYEAVVEWGSFQVNSYSTLRSWAIVAGFLKVVPFRLAGWLP